jgi:putative membrane protein
MGRVAKDRRLHVFLLVSLAVLFIWSYIGCFNFWGWFLEALLVFVGIGILISVYRRFRFTNLVYVLIWLHAIILLIGAHYTYSRVPVFNWIRDTFELSRNDYDRLGHFVQGFVPALIAREVLLRKSPLARGGWLFATVICFCVAMSAVYELIEWLILLVAKDTGEIFLAAQGDVWDAQKDITLCLIGACVSLVTMSKLHDRALKKISPAL